jgi:hypothetical protein
MSRRSTSLCLNDLLRINKNICRERTARTKGTPLCYFFSRTHEHDSQRVLGISIDRYNSLTITLEVWHCMLNVCISLNYMLKSQPPKWYRRWYPQLGFGHEGGALKDGIMPLWKTVYRTLLLCEDIAKTAIYEPEWGLTRYQICLLLALGNLNLQSSEKEMFKPPSSFVIVAFMD